MGYDTRRIIIWRVYKIFRAGLARCDWQAYVSYSERDAVEWGEKYGGKRWEIRSKVVKIKRKELIA